jgi:cytochrome c
MDSFEWNKIAGAVLFAMLVGFGVSALSEGVFSTGEPASPGYAVALQEAGPAEGGEAEAAEPIGVLMASADAGAGATVSRRCVGCHTFAQGEPRKVGPNLWDIVLHPIAGNPEYEGDYSPAMEAFAEQEEVWSYDHLNTFLTNPRGVVPGTKMNFNGLPNAGDRANLIAFLRTMSPAPAPLPEVEAAEAAPTGEAPPAEVAPAEEAPAEETPAGEAPAEEPPAADAPAEGATPPAP